VMELHTYSSLSKGFLKQYQGTMNKADIPVVFFNHHAIALKKLPPINEENVIEGFGEQNLKVFTNTAELENFLQNQNFFKTNLLLMSSGNFGGMDMRYLAQGIVSGDKS
jgi:UDP-N-acetylmuramate: L-alanyl-gamma-D-glutamyl-meso-diaminopimelate ligase